MGTWESSKHISLLFMALTEGTSNITRFLPVIILVDVLVFALEVT